MILVVLSTAVAVSYAQNTNATIRGQVLDPQGSVIVGAEVVVVNQGTGVTIFQGNSDAVGAFSVPQVIPGTYQVTVRAPGFRPAVLKDLNATVAQVTSVNITLQLGANNDTVTVEAKAEELDRGTSDISTLVTPSQVQDFPLQRRATENLLAFIPGVAHGGAANTPNTSQLSINGGRTLNTEVLLNGVSTIIASTGSPATLPSPDGVDSFRVLATNAPAEYGRTSGAVVSVNTISGTDVYHGNLYFLMRNEALDANTYFHKLTFVNGKIVPRDRDRFFQEGGSIGGPVRIPHLYDGRKKTFFFFNFDRTVQPNPTTLTFTVPTAAQRAGDLSNALLARDANGNLRPQVIFQPTGTSSPAFANNQVGPINPAAAKILAMLPLPNTVGTFDPLNNRYTGNWVSQQNLIGHTNKVVGRLDEQFTANDRLSINVYRFTTETPNPVSWNNPLLNTTWDCTCNNAWLPSINYTRVWTPSLVMDLNFGLFRNVVLRNPPGTGMNAVQQTGIATLPLDQMPQITTSGAFSNVGADTNTNQVNITNTFSEFGTVSKTIGPHTLKIGASLRKNQFNSFNPAGSPEGSLNFDGSITNHGNAGNPNTALADFLLGKIKGGNYQLPMPETGRRNFNLGVFVQDDWKVTPKLTINAGVRYEYESPLTIATNIYTRFDTATGNLLVAGQNGVSNSLNVKTPKLDFSPRIGFAYAITDKTILRAAFGTFYGTIFQNLGGQIAYPGYDVTVTYPNLGTAIAQPFSLSQGFQLTGIQNLQNPSAALASATAANPFTVPGLSLHQLSPMPLVEQWNAGIQRDLPFALTLEVNYVGNFARHLPYNIPYNIVPLSQVDAVTLANTTLASQQAKPFPTLSSFTAVDHVGRSDYNALQVSVRRGFSKNLAIFSNYTFAKSLDDGSTIYNFSAPSGTANAQYTADASHRATDRAVSNIDAKHTANIGIIYSTSSRWWWLRDWHISPVFVGHTGLPVNITQTNEISNVSQQRPNGSVSNLVLAHPVLNGPSLQYLIPVTDPNFPLTPSGPVYSTIGGVRTRIVPTGFGNVPRDAIRAPGEVNLDASVSKDFKITERMKFQFRVDAFNVLNHTNFTAPNTSLAVTTNGTLASFNSPNFGKITGTQGARTMQLSARLFF